MRLLALCGLGALFLAACETPPEVPVEMDPAAFQAAVNQADTAWHPYAGINQLTEIADTRVLSSAQRSRLLFERAKLSTEAGIDLPQAIQDLRAVRSSGTTPSLNAEADQLLTLAEAKLEAARARLAGLQNLSNWFDDKVATGEISAAADRVQKSGLSPNPQDAGLLEAAGYLCRKSLGTSDDWAYGEDNQHLEKLEWCSSSANS